MALKKHLIFRVLSKTIKGALLLKAKLIFLGPTCAANKEKKRKKITFSLKSFSSEYVRDINAQNSRGGWWSEVVTRQLTPAGFCTLSTETLPSATPSHSTDGQPACQIWTKCIFLSPACQHTWASEYLQQVKPTTKTWTNKQTADRAKKDSPGWK